MLFPQIPPDFFRGAEAEIKVDLGIFSGGLKAPGPEEPKELVQRVALVSSYIRKHENVGTVSDPTNWISGKAGVRFGVLEEPGRDPEYAKLREEIVFFGEEIDGKKVALIGSAGSLVGAIEKAPCRHWGYDGMFLQEVADLQYAETVTQKTRHDHSTRLIEVAFDFAINHVASTRKEIEFLARVVYSDQRVVMASPIYVAFAEDHVIGDQAAFLPRQRIARWWQFWKKSQRKKELRWPSS
jgi:hypothetical protein